MLTISSINYQNHTKRNQASHHYLLLYFLLKTEQYPIKIPYLYTHSKGASASAVQRTAKGDFKGVSPLAHRAFFRVAQRK